MKLYLAGPMTGIERHNYPAFQEAAEWLRSQGYEVVSPAELHPEAEHYDCKSGDYKKYLPEDLKALASCDAIVLLPGSIQSNGAMWEAFSALLFGLPCYRYNRTPFLPRIENHELWAMVSTIRATENTRANPSRAMVSIYQERLQQDAKWGEQNHFDEVWLAILGEEFGETSQAILHNRFGGKAAGTVRNELVQVAAVAMAWIECIDRRANTDLETIKA
jgi:nucleoside 2-deoxyribosyltransferase